MLMHIHVGQLIFSYVFRFAINMCKFCFYMLIVHATKYYVLFTSFVSPNHSAFNVYVIAKSCPSLLLIILLATLLPIFLSYYLKLLNTMELATPFCYYKKKCYCDIEKEIVKKQQQQQSMT